jgi:hypothetical protein
MIDIIDKIDEILKIAADCKIEISPLVGARNRYTAETRALNAQKRLRISVVGRKNSGRTTLLRALGMQNSPPPWDACLFVSDAKSFLNEEDLQLLMEIPPVENLLIVCSKADETNSKRAAVNRGWEVASRFIERDKRPAGADVLRGLKNPYFVSAAAALAGKKFYEDFDVDSGVDAGAAEIKIFSKYKNSETLKRIGGMEELEKALERVRQEKEIKIKLKLDALIFDAHDKTREILESSKRLIEKKIYLLSRYDKERAVSQKAAALATLLDVKKDLDRLFGEIIEDVDYRRDFVINAVKKRADFRLFEKKSSEGYSYIEAGQALESLRKFAELYKNRAQEAVNLSIDSADLKKKLTDVIFKNIGSDLEFYKVLVKNAVEALKTPVIEFETEGALNLISKKFTGEIKNAFDKESLKILTRNCLDALVKKASSEFQTASEDLKRQLTGVKNLFYSELEKNVFLEYDAVIENFAKREKEIQNYLLNLKKLDSVLLRRYN